MSRWLKLLLDPWGCEPCGKCGGSGRIELRWPLVVRTRRFRCEPCDGSGVVPYVWEPQS